MRKFSDSTTELCLAGLERHQRPEQSGESLFEPAVVVAVKFDQSLLTSTPAMFGRQRGEVQPLFARVKSRERQISGCIRVHPWLNIFSALSAFFAFGPSAFPALFSG